MTDHEHPDNNNKNTGKDTKNLIDSSSNKKTHSPDKGSNNSNKPPTEENEMGFKRRWFNLGLQNWIQIILACFTFFTLLSYIYFSYKQFAQTKEVISKADTANFYTRKAIDLSNKTLAYTIHSDSINDIFIQKDTLARERNTEMDLRAYCVIPPSVAFLNFSDSTKPGIIFKIKNVGKTPAYNVSTYAMLTITDIKPTHDLIDRQGFNILIIGSGDESAEQKFFADFSMNKQFFENIKTGKQFLFFILKVSYKDIFKKSRYLYFGSYYDFATKTPAAISDFADAN